MTTTTQATKRRGRKGDLPVTSSSSSLVVKEPGASVPGHLSSTLKREDKTYKQWVEDRIASGQTFDIPWPIWATVFEQMAQDLRHGTAHDAHHLMLALEMLTAAFPYDVDEWSQVQQFIPSKDATDCNDKPLSIGLIQFPIEQFRQK
jgi:hypothetical protein